MSDLAGLNRMSGWNNSGLVHSASVGGSQFAPNVPAPASFIDRIQISIDRIRKLTASVDLAADTLHGPVPTGIGSANQITMGAPAESVTKKIIDLADAVDMLERAVNRVGENI